MRRFCVALLAALLSMPVLADVTTTAANAPALPLTTGVTGTLGVTNGGTGVQTLTGVPLGTGAAALSVLDYVPWTDVAFSAGNFTANGALTWTLQSGDQTTFMYTILGKSMTVVVFLTATTTGGTANYALRIAVPAGKTITRTVRSAATAIDNGTSISAAITAGAGLTYLEAYRTDNANWSNASTNNTDVYGVITFQIN